MTSGHVVTLLEQAGGPASGASGQNGGQLSYGYVAPLASPSTLAGLPRLLFDPESPLTVSPDAALQDWRWCLSFLRACTQKEASRTTELLLEIARLSRARLARWARDVSPRAIQHARTGKLVVYRDIKSWRGALMQMALQAGKGPAQRACSADDCLQAEPALREIASGLAGGIYTPSEEVADCSAVCAMLLEQLLVHPNFEVQWRTRALAFERSRSASRATLRVDGGGGRERVGADAFVVANGVSAPALMRTLGERLEVAPLKGYSIDIPARCLRRWPRMSVTDADAKVVYAPLGSGDAMHLRVAGMAELAGYDLSISPRRIAQLRAATDALFGLNATDDEIHPWAGLRPATPTGRPIIGRSRRASNVFMNTGQGALGFTLAFGCATLLETSLRTSATPSKLDRSLMALLDAQA